MLSYTRNKRIINFHSQDINCDSTLSKSIHYPLSKLNAKCAKSVVDTNLNIRRTCTRTDVFLTTGSDSFQLVRYNSCFTLLLTRRRSVCCLTTNTVVFEKSLFEISFVEDSDDEQCPIQDETTSIGRWTDLEDDEAYDTDRPPNPHPFCCCLE